MSDLGSTIAPSEQVDGATPLPSQVRSDNPPLAPVFSECQLWPNLIALKNCLIHMLYKPVTYITSEVGRAWDSREDDTLGQQGCLSSSC